MSRLWFCFHKSITPASSWDKRQTKPNWGALYTTPEQFSSTLPGPCKVQTDWDTVTARRRLRRHQQSVSWPWTEAWNWKKSRKEKLVTSKQSLGCNMTRRRWFLPLDRCSAATYDANNGDDWVRSMWTLSVLYLQLFCKPKVIQK